MEIIWYGHACCALVNEATTIITDPFDKSLGIDVPGLAVDIVTVSHDNPRHNAVEAIGGRFKLIDRPGEYEIQGIFISGIALYPSDVSAETAIQLRNIVFVYEIDDMTICHLGDISHVPSQRQMETLDNVDILLMPVGGGRSLNAAKASEFISLIEPALVIPIHYALPGSAIPLEPLEKFLKEMGYSHSEAKKRLLIKRSSLPTETQIVVLSPPITEG